MKIILQFIQTLQTM